MKVILQQDVKKIGQKGEVWMLQRDTVVITLYLVVGCGGKRW